MAFVFSKETMDKANSGIEGKATGESQYEKDRKARIKARADKKKKVVKAVPTIPQLTPEEATRQQALSDIKAYKNRKDYGTPSSGDYGRKVTKVEPLKVTESDDDEDEFVTRARNLKKPGNGGQYFE